METQALVAVLVGQSVLRVEVARMDQIDGGLVVERGKVLSAVVELVLHDFSLWLTTALFLGLGVCRKSNRCICSGGVLGDTLW